MRSLLGRCYGAAATARRSYYASHPSRQTRLAHPVISVGNLTVGGSGKTPLVAEVARLLQAQGERPCILTRGYGRVDTTQSMTIVSTGARVLEGVDRAGDEPLWLARALPGVPVIVGADRVRSGRAAASRFDVSVLLLDDGFQHLPLRRDVDVLLVRPDDLTEQVLPAGRLREPLRAARVADAVVVPTDSDVEARAVAERLGVPTVFRVATTLGLPVPCGSNTDRGQSAVSETPAGGANVPTTARVCAVAGIARPTRFFDDLRHQGWHVVSTMAFRDHHPFTQRDVTRIVAEARSCEADWILTTEKDAVRLERVHLAGVPCAAVPLRTTVHPSDAFAAWLRSQLAAARSGQS